MDSAVLLDLLGNENRRRILRLLSHKSCYVTEISEYLGVSPKAVIDHLRKLEEAGIIESHTDDRRRKYFHIARDIRLEVNVSRHGFGAKSAYPANPSLDIAGRCPHMQFDAEVPSEPPTENDDLAELAAEFDRLQELESELSLAQRWVHGRISETLDRVNDQLGVDADSRFFAELLAAVVATDGSVPSVADEVGTDRETVEEGLRQLADGGLLRNRGGSWALA
ncbi:ArsR family transcriptional regulator [Halorarum halophilum]|uniref:ArsR family transcriptional regulator n=1 Tax=Halorarum halophilum TaxID=2743090 RepID=A0A7D5KTE3_9EURY|nr:ArsR family transcriptional regulator [Halobaculum halophilum]QLG26180.1 ArsR family transcriptional regulator [Halobaculum halophilum]